jgi:hypothetical protein
MATGFATYARGQFFEQDFDNGETLWLALAENCCIWSGSRALGYWIPEACTNDSDYDFYVPDNGHCIFGMVQSLEAAGVTLLSPLKELQDKFATGGHLYLSRWLAANLVAAFDDHWAPQYAGPLMHIVVEDLRSAANTLLDGAAPNVELTYDLADVDTNLNITVRSPASDDYEYMPGLQVIRGVGPTGKNVQLIFAPKMSATAHILRFHSTAVQCFIGPYGAAHLYWHDLTKSKQAWDWKVNTATLTGKAQVDRHEAGITKYKARGFTYVPCSLSYLRLCRISDPNVDFVVSTPDQMTFDAEADAKRRVNLLAFGWHQWSDQTRPILAPNDSGQQPSPEKPVGTYRREVKNLFAKLALRTADVSWIARKEVTAL